MEQRAEGVAFEGARQRSNDQSSKNDPTARAEGLYRVRGWHAYYRSTVAPSLISGAELCDASTRMPPPRRPPKDPRSELDELDFPPVERGSNPENPGMVQVTPGDLMLLLERITIVRFHQQELTARTTQLEEAITRLQGAAVADQAEELSKLKKQREDQEKETRDFRRALKIVLISAGLSAFVGAVAWLVVRVLSH